MLSRLLGATYSSSLSKRKKKQKSPTEILIDRNYFSNSRFMSFPRTTIRSNRKVVDNDNITRLIIHNEKEKEIMKRSTWGNFSSCYLTGASQFACLSWLLEQNYTHLYSSTRCCPSWYLRVCLSNRREEEKRPRSEYEHIWRNIQLLFIGTHTHTEIGSSMSTTTKWSRMRIIWIHMCMYTHSKRRQREEKGTHLNDSII